MTQALIDATLDVGNMLAAFAQVRANKGCAGTDWQTINEFENNLDSNLRRLQFEVRQGIYRPKPLLRSLLEEDNKKPRYLAIPAVRDRVLQTAVALVLTPIFEREFEDCSFAYRRGRSVDMAVAKVRILRDQGYRWVVDADIRAFFDEINHKLLLKEVARLVDDKVIMTLIHRWLRIEVKDGKSKWKLSKGVPQGAPLSPMLANLYLDKFDEQILAHGFRLVRFADDFLVLCKNRDAAQAALEITEDIMESLKLELNQQKTRVVDFDEGFRFLGQRFVRTLIVPVDRSQDALVPSRPAPPKPASSFEERVSDAAEKEDSGALSIALARAVTTLPNWEPPKASAVAPKTLEIKPEPGEQDATFGHDPSLRMLYLMQHGSVLSKRGERLVVTKNREELHSVPAVQVDQVMVFGNCQLTTQVMQYCLQENIPIVLLSGQGRYFGMIDALDCAPVILHRDQFARAQDNAFSIKTAKGFVHGKIHNSRLVLRRYARHRDIIGAEAALDTLAQMECRLQEATTLDEVRGYEGNAARAYFGAISSLVGAEWQFNGRVRQPPTDPVNALLSYGYTLLFYNIYAMLRARGLNTHVGFLHAMRSGHPALVSDLMEEFRPLVIDSLVLQLITKRSITPKDFVFDDASASPCLLNDATRMKVIHAFEKKMNTRLTHPELSTSVDYRRCIAHQVHHLAAVIRGQQEDYIPLTPR